MPFPFLCFARQRLEHSYSSYKPGFSFPIRLEWLSQGYDDNTSMCSLSRSSLTVLQLVLQRPNASAAWFNSYRAFAWVLWQKRYWLDYCSLFRGWVMPYSLWPEYRCLLLSIQLSWNKQLLFCMMITMIRINQYSIIYCADCSRLVMQVVLLRPHTGSGLLCATNPISNRCVTE